MDRSIRAAQHPERPEIPAERAPDERKAGSSRPDPARERTRAPDRSRRVASSGQSALTAAVRAARPSLASAKSIPVLGFA